MREKTMKRWGKDTAFGKRVDKRARGRYNRDKKKRGKAQKWKT